MNSLKINGYKVLIMGNHDAGASNYKRKIEEISYFNSDDMTQQDAERFKINGLDMILYPDRIKELLDKNKLIADKYLKKRQEDNKLFDEVYEGPLIISDKIILSHEPIENCPPFLFNIHGHDHSGRDFTTYVLKDYDADMPCNEMLNNYLTCIKKYKLNKLNTCAE
jgi:calcineurin-like phosphoesterase family protein